MQSTPHSGAAFALVPTLNAKCGAGEAVPFAQRLPLCVDEILGRASRDTVKRCKDYGCPPASAIRRKAAAFTSFLKWNRSPQAIGVTSRYAAGLWPDGAAGQGLGERGSGGWAWTDLLCGACPCSAVPGGKEIPLESELSESTGGLGPIRGRAAPCAPESVYA